MPLARFRWGPFVPDAVVDELHAIAGVSGTNQTTRKLVARICSATGGLPITEIQHPEAERTRIVRLLLHEASARLLRRLTERPLGTGTMSGTSGNPALEAEIEAWERVAVNTAAAADLEALPEIGPVLAEQIVEERTRSGAFPSLEELGRRVKGLGSKRLSRLQDVLVVDLPPRPAGGRVCVSADLAENLRRLMDLHADGPPEARLSLTLDLMATDCAGWPHPFTRNGFVRDFTAAAGPNWKQADWIGFLAGSEYYQALHGLLASAAKRIEICMFHIALPEPDHPTRSLLEALIGAHGRGVQVRVLMDRDRPEDPYRSTVINESAKAHLETWGVACRFDHEERLLHSKFVLIDDALVVLGSHNWSAGSYFLSDDLSLAVHSAALVQGLRERFDALWAET